MYVVHAKPVSCPRAHWCAREGDSHNAPTTADMEAICFWRQEWSWVGGVGFCFNAEEENQQAKQGAIYCSFTELLLGQHNKILLLSTVKLTHFQSPLKHFWTYKQNFLLNINGKEYLLSSNMYFYLNLGMGVGMEKMFSGQRKWARWYPANWGSAKQSPDFRQFQLLISFQ